LRDAQKPDFKKNTISAAAADGSVTWIRGDNLPVMGRLMLIHRRQGMASNYDCNQCACCYTYDPPLDYVYPEGANLLVGDTQPLTFYGGFQDCNHGDYYYNENGSASWSSGKTSIATVNSAGTVTGVTVGTTTVTGQFSTYAYVWNQQMWYCSSSLTQGGGGCTPYVGPNITGISPSLGPIGGTTVVTISGSGFGRSQGTSTVSAGSGITVPWVSWTDTSIVADFQVANNVAGGNRSVSVTTTAGTSNVVSFYVQIPSVAQVSSSATTSVDCTLNGNTTKECLTELRYQVMDQELAPKAIAFAYMIIEEYIHLSSDGCKTGGPSPGSWQTDGTGSMPANNPDGIGTCSSLCNGGTACTEAWYQKFTVYQGNTTYPVTIVNGLSTGACNYWTTPMNPTACSGCATLTVGSCPSPF
jgi:hypothetical protein